jgi:phosphate:Na+ symporter
MNDMLLYLFEGLALIVFGIRFLRKGLDRLFGSRLSSWLATKTTNRWRAFGAGIAAGTVAPSSTALSVLSLQMLDTGRLSAEKMLAVLLGGNVGMTVTAQLMASGVTNAAGYLLIIGVIGFQILQRELYRGIGQCLFALGLLFLGLHEISQTANAVAHDAHATSVLAMLLTNPAITLLGAAAVAVILQSSTATIGLALGLSGGGVFPMSAMIPWIIGTNIGVSITSLIVGWRSWDGRRLGTATLLVRALVAVPVILGAELITTGLSHTPMSPAHQIALLQTAFNLVVGIMAVPFLSKIVGIVHYLVAPQPGDASEPKADFLDEKALESPSLALAQATRQTQLMADQVQAMLAQYWVAETTRNTDLAKTLQRDEDKIDSFNTNISDYLSKISEGMSQEDTQWQFTLLAFSNELESVGDIIDKHLCDSIVKRAAELVVFSPAELEILRQVHEAVTKRFQVGVGYLSWRDVSSAKEFLEGKEKFTEWCHKLEREHFQRVKSRDPSTLGSSAYFLDVLNSLRRINSHISSIGYAFEE